MRYSKNKDIDRIVRTHVRKGWRFRQGRKHGKLVAPDGRYAVVPSSPSDGRALYNFLGDLRRLQGHGP